MREILAIKKLENSKNEFLTMSVERVNEKEIKSGKFSDQKKQFPSKRPNATSFQLVRIYCTQKNEPNLQDQLPINHKRPLN